MYACVRLTGQRMAYTVRSTALTSTLQWDDHDVNTGLLQRLHRLHRCIPSLRPTAGCPPTSNHGSDLWRMNVLHVTFWTDQIDAFFIIRAISDLYRAKFACKESHDECSLVSWRCDSVAVYEEHKVCSLQIVKLDRLLSEVSALAVKAQALAVHVYCNCNVLRGSKSEGRERIYRRCFVTDVQQCINCST